MKRRTLALGLLTGLTGCSILPERPPLKLYTLLANLSAQNCSAPKRRLSSVRINSPMIASPYDSTRCYVLAKDSRVYNTDINRFSSNPGNFIGDGLREVIQNCGPWNVVLSPNSISTLCFQVLHQCCSEAICCGSWNGSLSYCKCFRKTYLPPDLLPDTEYSYRQYGRSCKRLWYLPRKYLLDINERSQ